MQDVIHLPGPNADRLLVLCDHGSDRVPPDLDLGIPREAFSEHIAVDLGALAVAKGVAEAQGAPLLHPAWSRLVIDMNRAPEDPAGIPSVSDERAIPGNTDLSTVAISRRHALHNAYHDAISLRLDETTPDLMLSVHSFTPRLKSGGQRPWQAGLLYDQDARAARIAIAALEADGLTVGDNEPYDGGRFGYTMQRHAEPRGIPYLFLEIRQDLLSTADGQAEWAQRVSNLVDTVLTKLPDA